MEKWDYTFITCKQKGKDWFVKSINDVEIDRWDDKNTRQTPFQCAAKFGAEGWELAQVITAVGRNFATTPIACFSNGRRQIDE